MENIKSLEKYLKEGFDADVKTTEKGNTFRIQLPNEKTTKTFILDKDGQPEVVLDNDKTSPIDKSNPLNKFVKDAINGLRNITEQDRANEIERVSGNYPELIDDVRRAYDNGIIRINKPDSDKVYSLWDKIKDIEVGKVDKENNYIPFEDVNNAQNEWFTKTVHQVGKGEFYLPILFPDVYKNTKEEIGDNKLKIDDDKYIDLEIKTTGSYFTFDKDGKLSKSDINFAKNNKYNDSTKDKFKNIISKTLINYLLNRNTHYDEIDLILFDNQKENITNGIFVLRLNKNTKDNVNKLSTEDNVNELSEELEKIIEIDNSFGKDGDFDIRYDNTKKSIVVKLSSSKYNSNHKFKEKLDANEMNSMIKDFFSGNSKQLIPNEKKKHISDNTGDWPEFRMKVIKAAIDNGWSRAEITNIDGLVIFGKDMTKNYEDIYEYIKNSKDFDIIKFIWGKNSDYITSKDITSKDIDDDMLKDFIKGEGEGIDKLIKLMIKKEVDFSELIFGKDKSKEIKEIILTAENNNIEANNLIVKRNPPRHKRKYQEKLTEDDVIKIINGYCSDTLKSRSGNPQGKKFFILWLTKKNQLIKNDGFLSSQSLQKKLENSEDFLKKEKNNHEELNKKQSIIESYHIQTFDEMFND